MFLGVIKIKSVLKSQTNEVDFHLDLPTKCQFRFYTRNLRTIDDNAQLFHSGVSGRFHSDNSSNP